MFSDNFLTFEDSEILWLTTLIPLEKIYLGVTKMFGHTQMWAMNGY